MTERPDLQRLSDADIRDILSSRGMMTNKDTSRLFGVHESTVQRCRSVTERSKRQSRIAIEMGLAE